jgi:hypothetical protein
MSGMDGCQALTKARANIGVVGSRSLWGIHSEISRDFGAPA